MDEFNLPRITHSPHSEADHNNGPSYTLGDNDAALLIINLVAGLITYEVTTRIG